VHCPRRPTKGSGGDAARGSLKGVLSSQALALGRVQRNLQWKCRTKAGSCGLPKCAECTSVKV